jgi:hypothetical protein
MRKANLLAILLCLVSDCAFSKGLYVLGEYGQISISQQDATDAFTFPDVSTTNFGPRTIDNGVLILGYHTTSSWAAEISFESFEGRAYTVNYTSEGSPVATIQIANMGSPFELSIGPVYESEDNGFLFFSHTIHNFGVKLGYVDSQITESFSSASNNFSESAEGTAITESIFYRIRGPISKGSFNLGLEIGYDSNRIPTLTVNNAQGANADPNGSILKNYAGNSYFDNSGPYLRLVFGFDGFWKKIAHAEQAEETPQ